ncbi:Low-density lipoprotein (LDL) receptor class A repeat, partial [Trinorchestia longiramus]
NPPWTDGSDEAGCGASTASCVEGFRCWGGDKCLPPSWRCDGVQDCLDGEDELDCPPCASAGELLCGAGGVCLPANASCDGVPHCPDGWDESIAVCGHQSSGPQVHVPLHRQVQGRAPPAVHDASCPAGAVPCGPHGPCLGVTQLCDGMVDCPGGEDETLTVCVLLRTRRSSQVKAVHEQAE